MDQPIMTRNSPVIVTFLIFIVTCWSSCNLSSARKLQELSASNTTKFSAVLAFGDSTLDTGNNNYIPSLVVANHAPYGLNFPNHVATGRFSDGKLIPDLVATHLGIKEAIPPFLDPSLTTQDLVTGVCFASAGSGYDDITSIEAGVIPVLKQLDMFRSYNAKLNASVGAEEARKIINDALYIVSAGTNDFVVTYYDSKERRIRFPTIHSYHDFILSRSIEFIKGLYMQGARRIMVAGIPPAGCLPIQMTAGFENVFDRHCIQHQNSDAQAYNQKLVKAIDSLNLPGANILYANIYDPLLDIIQNPQNYGLEVTKKGCCGTGMVEMGPLCNELSPVCPDVSKHVFWDSIHPTHVVYDSVAQYLEKNVIQRL